MARKTKKSTRFSAAATSPEQPQDRVYFFRMNGCHHCEVVKKIWPQVVNVIAASRPSVKIMEVESLEKDKLLDDFAKKMLHSDQINAYPDLRILKGNGETFTFNSERTVPALVSWIETNVSPPHPTLKRIPTPYPAKKSKKRRYRSTGGSRRRKSHRRRRHV